MPFRDSLQPNRFEFKYLVDEVCAASVRDYVSHFLQPDPYADPKQGNSYPLSSLYLDTADLTLYRQTVAGKKNRFKLRIRFYDDEADSPALLELKRRVTDVVLKERAIVSRGGVRQLLAGRGPDASWLIHGDGDARSRSALMNFCSLRDRLACGSTIYVSYRREAYVSPENNTIRVTFDRQLMGSHYREGTDLVLPTEGVRPDVGNGDKVILELKFTDRFPDWMHELTQLFSLQRVSVPKYILCIDAMGLGVRPTGR
jgi:hypothetical protein